MNKEIEFSHNELLVLRSIMTEYMEKYGELLMPVEIGHVMNKVQKALAGQE